MFGAAVKLPRQTSFMDATAKQILLPQNKYSIAAAPWKYRLSLPAVFVYLILTG
jgi:hypothetical protein